jgi:hypothetical protein
MATFLPPIANFLGHQDGKHIVATITVYFHPARSAGSMEEAVILGIMAFCYAVFISVSSMAVSVFCETQLGLIEYVFSKTYSRIQARSMIMLLDLPKRVSLELLTRPKHNVQLHFERLLTQH